MFALGLVAAAGGCSEAEGTIDGMFTEERWAIVQTLADVQPVPPDPTNRYADDPAAAQLGQQLFHEKRYSGALTIGDDGTNGSPGAVGDTGLISCSSCHVPHTSFADSRSNPGNVSLGAAYTTRNAPSLINVAYYDYFGWAGKQDGLATQASGSPESGSNTSGNRLAYAHMIWDVYRTEYEAIFGPLPEALDPAAPDADRFPASGKPKKNPEDPDGAWEGMDPADQEAVSRIMSNCGKAMAAYERLLVSFDSPFDQYAAGDYDAISSSAKRGLNVFIGKGGCVDCHSGPTFSDNDFHNTGIAQIGANVPEEDLGRFKGISDVLSHAYNGASMFSDDPVAGQEKLADLVPREEDKGAFRTKALRNVAESAPYLHNGALETLADVVDFYDRGGDDSGFAGTKDPRLVPLNLTAQERDDLVAFLESLTGQPVPDALLEDTAKP